MIRNVSGNVDGLAKGERVHVEAPNHIPVPHKGAPRTVTAPDTTPDFLLPPTDWTPARCAPLRAGEALDVGEYGFIGQIGSVFAILPLAHALVMMASAPAAPDPMGIADEQMAHPLLLTKGDHRPRALVPQISDLAPLAGAGFTAGSLQSPIAAGAVLAPVTFLGDLAERLIVPPPGESPQGPTWPGKIREELPTV